MGGNGSRGKGLLDSEMGRNWKTVTTIGEIHVIQLKDPNKSNKLPEESHTVNRIYAIFEKDGSDVKAIAKYDSNGKKVWEIHTTDHKGLGHTFICGKMVNLLREVKNLLLITRNYWQF